MRRHDPVVGAGADPEEVHGERAHVVYSVYGPVPTLGDAGWELWLALRGEVAGGGGVEVGREGGEVGGWVGAGAGD